MCGPLSSGKIDTPNGPKSLIVEAPSGKLIAEYCVKAGSANQGLGPEYVKVNPASSTVKISHSSGKDISHYSVRYVDAPKQAKLTLVKEVKNDDGGEAKAHDWALQARLDGSDWATYPQGTSVEVPAGTYKLQELGDIPGYDLTKLVCTDSKKTSIDTPVVTLEKGEKVTCTFTNDDRKQPKKGELKLVKKVVNNDGGKASPSDWKLQVKVDGQWQTLPQGQFVTLPAGEYDLQETGGPEGYDLVSVKCDDDGGHYDKSSGGSDASSVTLEKGDKVTCTFTNDDRKQPKKGELKLVKKVVNNDGGKASLNRPDFRS